MTSKKISKEHLQNLLNSFERNESSNSLLMIYTYLNIIFLVYVFIRMGLYSISLIPIFFMISMIIITLVFIFKSKFSLQVNKKKKNKISSKLKRFLITGEMEKDDNLKKNLDRLKLTERHYKISQLVYASYFILIISLEFIILGLPNKILALTNSSDYNIITTMTFFLIELTLNILLLIFQTLRYITFKGIRRLRVFLFDIINKELKRIDRRIEKIMDLKLKEFKFNRKRLLKWLQKWNDIYLGSYFVGLREQLLISDYKNFVYSLGDENYYYKLFNDLKFKIEQANLSNSMNRDKNQNQKKSEVPICRFIEINIKMLNTNINSRLLMKNERRSKIRTSQTWIAIISITLSIIFSLSNLPSLIGL